MLDKGQWKEGDKVYGLPKLKTIRIKIKKEKAEKAAETTTAGEGATAAPAAATTEVKEAATPKQAGKTQEKK